MSYLEGLSNYDVFLQIGTNDGDDNFKQMVYKFKPKIVILVEPNDQLHQNIKENYKGIENETNVIILNKCIYNKDDEEVSLYIPAKDGVYGNPGVQPERALGNYTYNNKHFSLIPMNDWGQKKDMVEIKADLKVLLLTQYFWPESFQINAVAKSLHMNGVNVTVMTGKPNYPKGRFFEGYGFWGCTQEHYDGMEVFRAPITPRLNKNSFLFLNIKFYNYLY